MPKIAATTSWGVGVCVSLVLPRLLLAALVQSPQVPAPAAAAPAAPAAFDVTWQSEVAGTAPHAIVAGAAVVVASAGRLDALDAASGKALWNVTGVAPTSLAAGHGLLVAATEDAIRVLDEKTGAERWRAIAPGATIATALTSSAVYAMVGTTLHAWTPEGGAVWQRALSAPPAAGIAVHAGHVVLALSDATIAAVRADDGAVHWQHAVPALPRQMTASAGRIYFGGADGAVYAYDLDGSADPDWRFNVRAETIGAPAIDDRCVYVALIDNSIRALERDIGNLCWLTQIHMRPASGPVLLGNRLGIVTATGTLVTLDRKTGRLIDAPVTAPGAPPESRPRLLGSALGPDGTIYTLTVTSGGAPTVTAFRRKPG